MKQKIISLLERNNTEELQAYFDTMPAGKPLDSTDELLLLEHFSEPVLKSYISRFPLSTQAEALFVKKAPAALRQLYINLHSLKAETQNLIIKENLEDVAADFCTMRTFEDIPFLLENGKVNVIHSYLSRYPLENDALVLTLLHHQNSSLMTCYINNGRYISPTVLTAVIEEKHLEVFKAFCYRQYRTFKKKALAQTSFDKLIERLGALYLPETLQIEVLKACDWRFVEVLLKTTPLAPLAQKLLFDRKFDYTWLKLHVTSLYGTGGYRFQKEYEPLLFKALATKDMDECLTGFRHQDDTVFVQNASEKAVLKYLESFWLTDDAQVALIARGNATLIAKLISRYSPSHGLCWQAEVKLVEICSPQLIRSYTSFHTMCCEALKQLEQKSPAELEYYYSQHRY
ncbi:MAG: hypothetical protein J6J35_03610 [Alphaproteobacteria bacterium]|nr:hypothetical protein [Alphaproteobacteria bacterium]